MTTTTFDTEAFNEAAQALWNEARNRGYREGEEETTSRLARDRAIAMLEIAQELLRGEPLQVRDMALARMVLGKTPLVHPSIDLALSRFRTNVVTGGGLTPHHGQIAAGHVSEALEALR